VAPKLTNDFRIVQQAGTVDVQHVGSDAVRRILKEKQPMLGLHGHIHESRGFAFIGKTLCLNPGSEYNQGVLQGVIVDLEDGRVVQHQFIVG
jgi:Icc-related predicted phosphoesterase